MKGSSTTLRMYDVFTVNHHPIFRNFVKCLHTYSRWFASFFFVVRLKTINGCLPLLIDQTKELYYEIEMPTRQQSRRQPQPRL
jgi:hypothetical protein